MSCGIITFISVMNYRCTPEIVIYLLTVKVKQVQLTGKVNRVDDN